MLILRRKAGESIVIDGIIKVTVTDVYENGVRLAIDAPRQIPVLRSELLQAIDANVDAANEELLPGELMGLLGGLEKGDKQQ